MIINHGIKAIIDAMDEGEEMQFANHLLPTIAAYAAIRGGYTVSNEQSKMFTLHRINGYLPF